MRERGAKPLLQQLLNSDPSKRVISKSINLFKRAATAYLKQKIARGTLKLNRVQLQLDDFAWDCIAGLFERDESGNFVQLNTYFEQYDLNQMSDQEVYSACRRLIYSKVNDGIFRNFRTIDPALGKIIRNLKLSVRKNPSLTLENVQDMKRINFSADANPSNPLMPVELLKIRLTRQITPRMFISDSLTTADKIITRHEQYRNQYPVVELAKILRFAYTQLHENSEGRKHAVDPDKPLYKEDIGEFIEASIERVRDDMYETYLAKDKLDPKTFDIYFRCIEDILNDLFVDRGKTSSYFDHLKQYLDQVTHAAYRKNHRGYLEYLVKKARSDLIYNLRREF